MAGRPPPTKSRLPLYLGLTVAAGAGYYLYTAGGNPKVAEKQFERKQHLSGERANSRG
jgi:hypothetical protein